MLHKVTAQDFIMYLLVLLIAYYVLKYWFDIPGITLKKKLKQLGDLKGMTRQDVVNELGDYKHISYTEAGCTCIWQKVGYVLTISFDANDMYVMINNETSV